jgi:hypothetical protein
VSAQGIEEPVTHAENEDNIASGRFLIRNDVGVHIASTNQMIARSLCASVLYGDFCPSPVTNTKPMGFSD